MKIYELLTEPKDMYNLNYQINTQTNLKAG